MSLARTWWQVSYFISVPSKVVKDFPFTVQLASFGKGLVVVVVVVVVVVLEVVVEVDVLAVVLVQVVGGRQMYLGHSSLYCADCISGFASSLKS